MKQTPGRWVGLTKMGRLVEVVVPVLNELAAGGES